jgi:hypothetical protein
VGGGVRHTVQITHIYQYVSIDKSHLPPNYPTNETKTAHFGVPTAINPRPKMLRSLSPGLEPLPPRRAVKAALAELSSGPGGARRGDRPNEILSSMRRILHGQFLAKALWLV